MWRYLLLLLLGLPPLAIALNRDALSAVIMIVWTVIVIPLCILQTIDFLRNGKTKRPLWVRNIIRVPVALLGLLSLLIGGSIIVWCLYNVVIQQLPEYSGPTDAAGLWLGGFGIAPLLVSFGWYLLHLALGLARETQDHGDL